MGYTSFFQKVAYMRISLRNSQMQYRDSN